MRARCDFTVLVGNVRFAVVCHVFGFTPGESRWVELITQKCSGSRWLMNFWNAFQVRAHPDSGWWMNSDFPHGGHDGHRIRLPMQNSADQHERKVHWTLVLQNISQKAYGCQYLFFAATRWHINEWKLHYGLTVKLMPSCCCAGCVVVGAIVLRKMRARSQGEFGRYGRWVG